MAKKDFSDAATRQSLTPQDIMQFIAHYRQQAARIVCPVTGRMIYSLAASDPQTGHDYDIHFSRAHFSRPSRDFEKAAGIGGVSARYALPAGVSPETLTLYAVLISHAARQSEITAAQEVQLLSRLVEKLKTDNPALRCLSGGLENAEALGHIVYGVASGFSVPDIRHYIAGNYRHVSLKDKAYKALFDKVEKMSGTRISWVPAPETLRKIERKLSAGNQALK